MLLFLNNPRTYRSSEAFVLIPSIFTYLFRLLFCFAAQIRAFRRAHQVQRNLATIRTHLASCLRGESLCGPPHRRKYPCQISKRTCTPLRWLPHRFNQQTFVVSECYTVRVRSLKSTSSCSPGEWWYCPCSLGILESEIRLRRREKRMGPGSEERVHRCRHVIHSTSQFDLPPLPG